MVKQEEAVGWQEQGLLDLLTDVARGIGVGTPADFGWAPPPPPGAPPQVMMTGGIPDPSTLPGKELLDSFARVLANSQPEALRYGGTEGFEPLRAALAERWGRVDNLPQTPQNFVLTNGSSGAIDLVCSAFVNPGDGVIVESPSYSGTLRTFRGHGARLLAAPIDAEGVDVDAIEALLKREQADGRPVKLIYLIPDYQNPTGTLLSLARRERLIELSNRYRVLILEDDAYIDLAFSERPLPSLYAVAEGHGVLRAGTFSKTLATGLRVGWVQGRIDFVAACVQMRFDMGASPLLHRALAELVGSGMWERHVAEVRDIYAEKCEAICRGLLEECEPYAQFVRPQGGFFVWLRCRDGLSAAQVQRFAMDEGVMVVPGRSFFPQPGDDSYLRLAFSTVSPAELREGARRLGRAFARAAG